MTPSAAHVSAPLNGGRDTRGRFDAAFAAGARCAIAPGQALWLPLQAGDLISCAPARRMRLAAFDYGDGQNAIQSLLGDGCAALTAVKTDERDYDGRLIAARLRALGLAHNLLTFYQFNRLPDGAVVWRCARRMILIVAAPEEAAALVSGGGGAPVELEHKRVRAPAADALPPPLARLLDEFTIARGTARSYAIPRGAYVQIMDVEGRQCSDFTAFNARALDAGEQRYIDSTVSRTFSRGAYPRPGLFNKFYDGDITPLLEVVQDTVGRHDTFALACTARGYEERGFPGHVNCSDNISRALAGYGIPARRAWPAINFFFNSWILPAHNQLQSDEAWSRPGDYVLLKALTDLVAVSTACPDDIDPINGWNPTDIHVRLYAPQNDIKPAAAYRLTPNEPAIMTVESPFHRRTSALTGQFAPYLDYWTPQSYERHGVMREYRACRESATMQDMSNLRIYDICGNDALPFLQSVLTRDVGRIGLNKGRYALICDDSGGVLDDGTLFNIGENIYRWTCSSGESLLHLQKTARDKNFHVWIRDMSRVLCTLSVQGPESAAILRPLLFIQPTQPAFANIPWFGGAVARLHDRDGAPLYVSRTGYSGEMGYELFCDNRDAEKVWDAVADAGGDKILPMGAQALNILRVEAGFAARGCEFGNMEDPDEAGLSFAVDEDKTDFTGAAAIRRNRAAPRRRLTGLVLDGGETARGGDTVYCGRYAAGRVTSAVYSPALQRSAALALINSEHAEAGKRLDIGKLDGHAKRLSATVTPIPFVDARRRRPRGL